jgi:hypothetical protein
MYITLQNKETNQNASMVASKPVKAKYSPVVSESDARVRTVRLVTRRQQRVRRMAGCSDIDPGSCS